MKSAFVLSLFLSISGLSLASSSKFDNVTANIEFLNHLGRRAPHASRRLTKRHYVDTGDFGPAAPGNIGQLMADAVSKARALAVANCYNGAGSGNANWGDADFLTGRWMAFGDSWTTDGTKGVGSAVAPLCTTPHIPWKPSATCAYEAMQGRAADSYEWIEYFRNTDGIDLTDYAVSGAYTDTTLFPGATASDFQQQYDLFKSQNKAFDKDTTFSIFFGINDWYASIPSTSEWDGTVTPAPYPDANFIKEGLPDLLKRVADQLVNTDKIGKLVIVGLPHWDIGNNYPQVIEDWVKANRWLLGQIQIAYVHLAPLFDAVRLDPNPFGFTEDYSGECVEYTTTPPTFFRQCDDPRIYSWFANAHPTGRMHELMYEYTKTALNSCKANGLGIPATTTTITVVVPPPTTTITIVTTTTPPPTCRPTPPAGTKQTFLGVDHSK
ncbi:hypothetical protein DFH09DRAFT_1145160 [Mycena vulgaris]|nr:hypothetical protein DFH09DRAFT_1145160 [Mycena vulgaris]